MEWIVSQQEVARPDVPFLVAILTFAFYTNYKRVEVCRGADCDQSGSAVHGVSPKSSEMTCWAHKDELD